MTFLRTFCFAIIACLAVIALPVTSAVAAKPVATTGAAIGGEFALTDHNGVAVTDKTYDGKAKLVYFGFTHCPDICPNDMARLTATLKLLDEKTLSKSATLFITIDPERDTPDVMKNYVELYHPAITGLTGTKEQIKAVESAYKVYSAKVEDDSHHGAHGNHGGGNHYMMNHSAYIYLMDKDGTFIDVFNNAETPDNIAKALKRAAK